MSAIRLAVGLFLLTLTAACPEPKYCQCHDHSVKCSTLTSLPEELPENTTHFTCDECRLTTIANLSESYARLNSLRLTKSKVMYVKDGAFKELSNLMTLDLSDNLIKNITKETLRGLDSLTDLDMRINYIYELPAGFFFGLPALVKADFSNNMGLAFSEGTFTGASPFLEEFICENCGISDIQAFAKALELASALHTLKLARNEKLTKLSEKAFHPIPQLRELDLSKCKIQDVSDGAFDYLTSLVTLDLSLNKISDLRADTFHDPAKTLLYLNLYGNQITVLDKSYEKLGHLEELNLEGNPWMCDCAIVWMQKFDSNLIGNVTCDKPDELRGELILNFTSLTPCRAEDCRGANCGGGISAVALGIAIPIIIICICILGCYVYRSIQSRRRRSNERKSVKYSSVYKDTVESSPNPA